MSPAEITALRAQACKVFAHLGRGLAALEDAEGYASMSHAKAFVSLSLGDALDGFESAAAHLADLITAADRAATALAPQGDDALPIS